LAAVAELSENQFSIYPNPSSGFVHIESADEKGKIAVIDPFGRTIKTEELKNGKIGEILEAYKYSKEQKQVIGDNIQKVNDTLYLYSFPIQENALVYKNCHKDLGLIMMSKKVLVKSVKK
jgi:hypothetical protein